MTDVTDSRLIPVTRARVYVLYSTFRHTRHSEVVLARVG